MSGAWMSGENEFLREQYDKGQEQNQGGGK